jgi:type IV pilus assembly protein PilA
MNDASRFCGVCGADSLAGAAPAAQSAVPPIPWVSADAPTSSRARASMILGMCCFLFGFVAGVPAIILGHLSKAEIRKSGGRLRGDGMAFVGLILGYFSVAIIPIIAAVAIPNLIRAKMSANEVSTVYKLKTIVTSAQTYSATYGNSYPASLGALGGPPGATVATCDNSLLVESVLSNDGVGNTSRKSGYSFTYVPGTPITVAPSGCNNPGVNSFAVYAVPVQIGSTGQRGFLTDPSGTILLTTDGSIPTSSSPALQ